MIQLVIPMAGLGSRFSSQGYSVPKPLLPVHGFEMYKVVIANLVTQDIGKIVLISPERFELANEQKELSKKLGIEVTVVEVRHLPNGPAMSVKLSRDVIDLSFPVVTANSDQYVSFDPQDFYKKLIDEKLAGQILTMEDSDPKWSFVKTDARGKVLDIKEKQVISNQATVGIYGYKRASDLFDGIDAMVSANDRTNNEFYLAPVYKYLSGYRDPGIGTLSLGPVGKVMHGLGTPEDYERFLKLNVSEEARIRVAQLFEIS